MFVRWCLVTAALDSSSAKQLKQLRLDLKQRNNQRNIRCLHTARLLWCLSCKVMWKDFISIRRDTWMRKSNVYSDRWCEMKCWQKVFGSWTLQGDFVMEVRLHVAAALSTHIHIFTHNNSKKTNDKLQWWMTRQQNTTCHHYDYLYACVCAACFYCIFRLIVVRKQSDHKVQKTEISTFKTYLKRFKKHWCAAHWHETKYPSIHPFSSAYPGPGRRGSCLSRDTQTSLSPDTENWNVNFKNIFKEIWNLLKVNQWVRDSVEGQSASRTVHIHCYSVRDRGGGGGGGGGGEE